MSKAKGPKSPPADTGYEVGFKLPPVETRFKPGQSGNLSGKAKRLKRRDMSRQVQEVFTRPIVIRDGERTRRVPSIIALIQRAVVDAMKGDKQAARFCYRIAEQFGVFKLKDSVDIDFSRMTEEERAICAKGMVIMNRAGMLFRYEDQ